MHLRDLVASTSAKMLRTGPWKYIYTLVDGHVVEQELYNLDDDPDELYNLAHDPAQANRLGAYRDEILRWLDRESGEQRKKIDTFVILDDDSDMSYLMDYLIQCNPQ